MASWPSFLLVVSRILYPPVGVAHDRMAVLDPRRLIASICRPGCFVPTSKTLTHGRHHAGPSCPAPRRAFFRGISPYVLDWTQPWPRRATFHVAARRRPSIEYRSHSLAEKGKI
ncbi:hypothetical protein BO78DRAFT_195984 [Aspergillus sclerotiicarbonarius CBS 121057]|uniref:Secreted protein n=1 Tax=Aspergillus sclerotiicarbonarius (strain CBS 121057 / IBT 28362) TaxID=1448318 RepID=A0A319EA28_ASPSB|nr:hypothetical protein BO78DRAFT_195984 [Aspergillus sclerotiicarbonarius CBS 121057]